MRPLVTILLAAGLLLSSHGSADADSRYPSPTNIRVTTIPQLNNEEQVWICPTDSSVIIANWRDFRLGFRQIGIGRSTDGGQTWTDSLIHWSMQYFREASQQSDPTLTVDRLGRYYISALDYVPGMTVNGSVIAFYRSDDRGVSWYGPFAHAPLGAFFEDKQFITVDRTGGPYDGNLYCAWARFQNPNRIMFVRSTNGAETFDDTLIIGPIQSSTGCGGPTDAGQFANPVVSSGGTVHVFWQGTVLDSGAVCSGWSGIKQRYSLDGGQTFAPERVVIPVSGYTSADGGIATYSQPAADADITGGPFDGHVYISFTNVGPEDTSGNSDVDFVRSIDGGITWSERTQINDEVNSDLNDSFHPWLVVNDEGVIMVLFYDQRYDAPNYFLFDAVAAYSFDGGATFTANHRISSVSSSPGELKSGDRSALWEYDDNGFQRPLLAPTAGLIGEYIGVTAFHDKINAVWTDSRDGNSEVYTANWYLPLLEPRLLLPADSTIAQDIEIFTWATSWKHNQDRYRLEASRSADFATVDVAQTLDTNFVAGLMLPGEGRWYWRVKTLTVAGDDSSAAFSPVRTIEIDRTPPHPPVLLQPQDDDVTNDATPVFAWAEDSSEIYLNYTLSVSTDPVFPAGAATQSFVVANHWSFELPSPLVTGTTVYWKVQASDLAQNSSDSETRTLTYQPYVCGDVNGSGGITVSDLTYFVSYLFRNGTPPSIAAAADVNGDGKVSVSDLTYLVNFLFRGGLPPTC